MITKAQAINNDVFHHGECKKVVGPRGGVTILQKVWRRNGMTQTWKTRPDDFRIPVKYGVYGYGQIWQHMADLFHVPEDCPLNQQDAVHSAQCPEGCCA